eukprot:TRINITY_DN3475_c0_g1_i1.p1 TRINITY_DN3475_c0_g1~~TRINITY_DN3475_c0_g1_i1.p1  ORF type:complete len:246 (+),score=64.25 TRINITY_DN3475_c0_g1_i1:192-929(+)
MAAFCKCLKGIFNASYAYQQCLLVGLDGVGKTTLMYRLMLGREVNLQQDLMRVKMVPDTETMGENQMKDNEDYFAAYLYEEFGFLNNCGIWDIPGTPAMQMMWKLIYQTIQVHGVFYVIDACETSQERLNHATKLLHMLTNEEELRQCFVAVIINTKSMQGLPEDGPRPLLDPKTQPKEYLDKENWWHYELGLDELPESSLWRVKLFLIDVDKIDGEGDRKWAPVLNHCKDVLQDERSFHFHMGP